MAKKGLKTARTAGNRAKPQRSAKSASVRAPELKTRVAPKPAHPRVNGKPAIVATVSLRSRQSPDRRAMTSPAVIQRGDKVKAVVAEKVKAVVASPKKLRREKVKEPLRPLVPLPPPPVTTDSKPKKNLAGLSVKELDGFRSLLLAKRRELLGDMSSMEREALQSGQGSNLSNLPVHMADMGTDNYEQEFTLGLVEKDRQLLREINHALVKIQDGSYGICEGTGKPINKQRLEIQPWARFSVEHARALEKNMMIKR